MCQAPIPQGKQPRGTEGVINQYKYIDRVKIRTNLYMAGICSSATVVCTQVGALAQIALKGYLSNQLDDLRQAARVKV